MINLIYPTPTQPRSTPGVSALYGEPIRFRFDTSGSIISIGAFPSIQFNMGTLIPPNGTTFQFYGITYTVDNTINDNTDSRVNLTTNHVTNASRIAAMLASNPRNAGLDIIIFNNPTHSYIVIQGQFRENIPAFTINATNLSPFGYAVPSQITGINQQLLNEYALVYRVFVKDVFTTRQVFPKIGEWHRVPLTLSATQQPVNIEIAINDILAPQLYVNLYDIITAADFLRISTGALSFFIEYAYSTVSSCRPIIHEIKRSTEEFVVYAALGDDDAQGGMSRYVYPNLNMLTRRINNCIPRGVPDFASFFFHFKYSGWSAPQIRGTYEYLNVTGWTTIMNNVITYHDGYYIHKIGTNVGVPINATKTRLRIIYDDITVFEREFTIDNCVYAAGMYFLNDLGGFDPIFFEEIEYSAIEVSNKVICIEVPHLDADMTFNSNKRLTRLARSSKRIIETKGMIKYKLITPTVQVSELIARNYIMSFLKSPQKYIYMHTPNFTIRTLRAAYIETGSFVYHKDGENIRIEVNVYLSNDSKTQ